MRAEYELMISVAWRGNAYQARVDGEPFIKADFLKSSVPGIAAKRAAWDWAFRTGLNLRQLTKCGPRLWAAYYRKPKVRKPQL